MRVTLQNRNTIGDVLYRILRKAGGYALLITCSLFAVLTGKKLIFITTPFGDLGNRLFLFSNIIAFSLENNAIVIHLGLEHFRNHLEGTYTGLVACFPPSRWPKIQCNIFESALKTLAWSAEAISLSRYSLRQWKAIRINNSSLMAFEMLDLENPQFRSWFKEKHVLFLSGYQYLASESIQINQHLIRNYLRLRVSESEPLVARHREFLQNHDFVIGVVIRHGDYRQFMGGRYFYETTCYTRWIKQLMTLFPGKSLGFIITGNDDVYPEGLDNIDFIFAPHSSLATRYVLSRCNMIISPPSSYAGWCAFSGNIPLLLISSSNQQIHLSDCRAIYNLSDLREPSMPENIDHTQQLINEPI